MDLDTVKTLATWAIIALAVVGILAAIIIKKIIGKVISLVLAAVVIFFLWQQRDKVTSYAEEIHGKACSASPSFFGIDVTLPDSWCSPS